MFIIKYISNILNILYLKLLNFFVHYKMKVIFESFTIFQSLSEPIGIVGALFKISVYSAVYLRACSNM